MKSYLKTSDHFLTKESFNLLYDEKLDMLVTDPQPSDLGKYYDSKEYISHTDESSGLKNKLYQFVKKINLRSKLALATNHANNNFSLLDVGAGTGDFLMYAKTNGWKVEGVEPNDNARLLAQKKSLFLKEDLAKLEKERFQVITLWHVLEHLPHLEASIATLCNKLEEEGTLFIAVPNFRSFDARHYKSYWAAYDAPRHLWHFSKKAIQELFAKHDMTLVKTKPMWFDSFYVSLLSEEYKTGKKNWLKSFLVGLWSNLKGITTQEFSSHIYILQKQK